VTRVSVWSVYIYVYIHARRERVRFLWSVLRYETFSLLRVCVLNLVVIIAQRVYIIKLSRKKFFSAKRKTKEERGSKLLRKMRRKKKLSHNARHLIRILLVILRIRRSIRGVDGYGSGNVVIRDA